MSIPSGAAYNRCRPVPPWNGSLSASRPLPATTLCWRDYKRECGDEGMRGCGPGERQIRARPFAFRVLTASLFFLAPVFLGAQQPAPTNTHPEVVNLTLKGVKSVKPSDLLASIYTTASYCNSLILK